MSNFDLKQIIIEHPDCINNGTKLKAILLDTYPDLSKAVVNTLVIMVNSGIVKEIQDSENITEFDKSRWQKKLGDDYGISDKYIEIALEICIKSIDSSRNSNFETYSDKYVDALGIELKKAHTVVLLYKQTPQYKEVPEKILEYALISNTARAALFGLNEAKQSYERAFVLFEYLFKQYSQPDIAYYLGYIYENGYFAEQDYDTAYRYYMLAATDANKNENLPYGQAQESAKAKFNLGKMIVNHHEKINVKDINSAYYWWAIGLYLCAADDGLREAYDWLKALGSLYESDNDEDENVAFMNPIPVFDKAKTGDTEAMFELANIYLSQYYMPEFRVDYALKWAKKGYETGDKKCMQLYIALILGKDIVEYNKNPDCYEIIHQEGQVFALFAALCGNKKENNPCDEILVVHSKLHVSQALKLFVEFCSKYQDKDDYAWVTYQYLDFINTANSFMRPKKGLPGYKE